MLTSTTEGETGAPTAPAPGRVQAGALAAIGSALAYGLTVVIGRSLARDGLDGPPVLAYRFGISAAVLFAFLAFRRSLLPPPGERLRAVGVGMVYAVQASCFFAALGRGSAGAVTLVFYAYPAMTVAVELLRRTLGWSRRLGAALALSVAGVLTVVAAGSELSVTPMGAALALAAAALFTVYLLAGDWLIRATDPVVRAAWTSAGAGATLTVVALVGQGRWPGADRLGQLLVYGLANAVAFGLLFVGLRRIGPTRTAVILNFEVVASVVLAAALLDESIGPLQAVGGVAVVAGAVLVSVRGQVSASD